MNKNLKLISRVALSMGLLASGAALADGSACGGFIPAVPTLATSSEAVQSTVEYEPMGCTGTLVNDIPGDQKPYMLTATHCLAAYSDATAGATFTVTVNWLAYDSGAIESVSSAARATTTGTATVEAISGDVALVLLPGVAPGGTYFSSTDFTLVPVGSATGFNVFDDHHASRNSQQLLAGTAAYQNSDVNGNAANYQATSTNGAVVGGSSGSGLRRGTTTSGGPVIAILSLGDSSSSSVASCSALFTSIAQGWQGGGTPTTAFHYWLDPNNTGLTAISGTASTTPFPPTLTLTSSATSVNQGEPVTLTWTSSGAASCTASGSDLNFQGSQVLNGSATLVPPAGNQTYTLSCANTGGTIQRSVNVQSISASSSGGGTSSSGGGGGALGLGLLIPLMGAAGVRRRKGVNAE